MKKEGSNFKTTVVGWAMIVAIVAVILTALLWCGMFAGATTTGEEEVSMRASKQMVPHAQQDFPWSLYHPEEGDWTFPSRNHPKVRGA